MPRPARHIAKAALDSRVVRPVTEAQRTRRALGAEPRGRSRILVGVGYLLGAAGLHAAIVAGLVVGGPAEERPPRIIERVVEKVTVRVVDPPAPVAPPAPAPPVREAPMEVAPATTAVEAAEVEPPVKKRPRRQVERSRREEPPADWVDLPSEPVPEANRPRRRVVGLSFESTVTGGSGASFAVGNTRMGITASRAEDPRDVEKLRPAGREALVDPGPRASSGANRVATRLPAAGATYTKPKRISKTELEYPGVLKAQGIEGNVVVLIRITTEGGVSKVKVIKSSGYREFDEAARRAAERERFEPATRDGEAVAYNLKYTYRFRIKQS
jgi:protein TonB